MKNIFLTLALVALVSFGFAQTIDGFTLKDTKGASVRLSAYSSKTAVVVIFTSNHCVYSKKYEDRIIALNQTYSAKNVQFILINSNDPALSEEDNLANMQLRVTEKGYTFPYLQDADGAIAKKFGATKNPEAFVLIPSGGSWTTVYSGKIDDNPLMADQVSVSYLKQSLDKVLSGDKSPSPKQDSNGCNIKFKE